MKTVSKKNEWWSLYNIFWRWYEAYIWLNKTKTKNKMRPDQCWCSTLKTQQTTTQIKTNKFKENRKSDTCIPDLRDKKRRKKRRGSLAMVMMPCLQRCTNVSTAILFSGSGVNEKLNDI